MTNEQLDLRITRRFKFERFITAGIIVDIAEAERRKLFEKYETTSIFGYLLKKGYSKNAAQARLDGARLYQRVPQIEEYLRSNALCLTQVGVIMTASRKSKTAPTRELVEKVLGRTVEETQMIVAQEFNIEPRKHDKKTRQADGSIRFGATLTDEQNRIYEAVKDFISHSLQNPSLGEWIEFVGRDYLKIKKAKRPPHKRAAHSKDVGCQHIYPSGEKCGSTWQLQVDHIFPKWAGGSDDPTNLQPLCGSHNRWKFREESCMM